MRHSKHGCAKAPTAPPPPIPASEPRHRLVCIVPLYMEQDLAEDTARFWHALAQQKLFDQVLLVTTAKEQPTTGPSTHELIKAELERLGTAQDRVVLQQCEEISRFRAAQLNLATSATRARFLRDAEDTANIWVGVYNADSRPDSETFAELRTRALTEPHTRVFQQLVDYVAPMRGRVGLVAIGNSILQTWWTMSHYIGRSNRGRAGNSAWSRTAPYSTFGHGEFIRLDFIEHIGGFPDFAYADGLLLGWICRLAGEPIGLLASRDVAEVPRSARDLLTQQTAWLRGLLNFGSTVRWCRDRGVLRLPDSEVWLLRGQHMAIPVAWGLSTVAVMLGIATASQRLWRRDSAAYDLAALGGLVAYPVIPALVPAAERHREIPLSKRVMGTLMSWPVEGLAFWVALRSHVQRSQHAPAKTPR